MQKKSPPNAGKGRRKGVPNKVTGDVRAMISRALIAAGGEAYLTEQAKENPPAFMALVGKTLPKDVTVTATGSLNLSISLSK